MCPRGGASTCRKEASGDAEYAQSPAQLCGAADALGKVTCPVQRELIVAVYDERSKGNG